ncbi:MAG: hypothetical protein GQ533_14385 [Methanosarcinaceae archaeon]|nr:hypothetical protein [Methanosarcinaceae archaeon]
MNLKRMVPILVVLFIATVLMLPTATAAASSRTMPASVEPGEQFTVSMEVSDYGTFGGVVETIPNGFTYDGSTLSGVTVDGNSVYFILYGETSFEYTVTASNTEDNYMFSGIIIDVDNTEFPIADSSIDVETASQGSNVASASRTIPASVEPGEQFTVSMEVSDYGTFGGVVETIPNGFTYDGSTLSGVTVDGNSVYFILYGESSFEYTVTASNTEDNYMFSGIIIDEDDTEFDIADSSIDVETASQGSNSASASRIIPASVEPGEQFTVSMEVLDYGDFGGVVETIPNGFTYDGSTLSGVTVDGNSVYFVLYGETIFEYTVTASSTEDTYMFSGILKDEDNTEFAIADSSIDVETALPDASAVRTLPASVERGEEFTVSMEVSDYGTTGSVVETIPKSFTYVNSTLDTPNVIVANDTVTFNLEGETNFEYIVTASSIEGTYAFSGVLIDESANEVVVGGDTSIDVVLPDGIILQSGWNFISVPHELSDLDADNVLTGITDDAVLTCYNAETRLWETVTTIEPMKGYWIYIPEDTQYTQVILDEVLEPVVPVGPVSPPSIQLYEGWNTIGYTDSAATLPAELTLAAIDESYTSIWGPWNPETMSYEYFGHNGQIGVIDDKHVGTDVFEMSPYNGYWVYVTQDCVLNSIGG